MTKDEALKLALVALELAGGNLCKALHHPKKLQHGIGEPCPAVAKYDKAITAIKEALAQPEQTNTRPYYTIDELNAWADEKEKKAWRNAAIRIGEELSSVGPDSYYEMDAWKWLEWAMEQEPRGKNSLAPQRTWVGLTDEDKSLFSSWLDHKTDAEVFAAIEAKLKEKNT